MVPEWAWWAAYGILGIIAFRWTFRAIYESGSTGDSQPVTAYNIVLISALAFAGATFAPILLPSVLWCRYVRISPERVARILGGESREMKIKRLQSEKDAHARRIAELERELLDAS